MNSPGRSPSRVHSLRYAWRGWWLVLRTQRNAWIHAAASLIVFGLAAWLRIPSGDWALILLAVGLVWMAEFLNTALEAVVDLASPHAHPLARAGKDIGAAAVLIAAATAAAIGLLVLGPRLLMRFNGADRLAYQAAGVCVAAALRLESNCDIIGPGPRRDPLRESGTPV